MSGRRPNVRGAAHGGVSETVELPTAELVSGPASHVFFGGVLSSTLLTLLVSPVLNVTIRRREAV